MNLMCVRFVDTCDFLKPRPKARGLDMRTHAVTP